MRKMKSYLYFFLLAVIPLQSCDFFPEPQEPDPKAELELLLPNTQYLVAYLPGTDLGRFQLQWMQQLAGVRGSHLSVDRYNMHPEHNQEIWNLYYLNIYPNIRAMHTHATTLESPAYRGITRVLHALALGLMTDAWGDIPHTSAIDYSRGFLPPYEAQSSIYMYLHHQLTLARNELTQALTSQALKPGPSEDLIYGGNLEKWIRAANVIQLRYMLRLAHQTGSYEILTPLLSNSLFTGNSDDMVYAFHSHQVNPHFFYDQQIRNTRMGSFLVELLRSTQDPRLPVFVRRTADVHNQFLGSGPGEANFGASFIGTAIAAEKAPVSLITFVEQKFIMAEVFLRTGQQSLADQAFEMGVRASLQKYAVSNPAWETQHADISNVTLEQIITAKYIALFLNPEVWSDFRRTGFPRITPFNTGTVATTQIPRRFVYPTVEVTHNAHNMPADITIFSRVWWDEAP